MKTFLSSMLGAVVGVAVALALPRLSHQAAQPPAQAAPAVDRVLHVERVLEERHPTSPVVVAPRPETEAAPARPSFDELLASDARAHDALVARVQAETVDVAWSAQVAPALAQELGQMGGQAAFDLVGIECRTRACIATLQWPSREEAVASARTLAMNPFRAANCARTVFLPEDSDGHDSYRATVTFHDCQR
jgi:hypothetical protein